MTVLVNAAGKNNTMPPTSRPVDEEQIGELISEETQTYTEGDLTITETYSVYEMNDPFTRSSRSEKKVFHKKEWKISATNGTYGYLTLDADFYCDADNNTVTCDRYFTDYDDTSNLPMKVYPHETGAEFSTGKSLGRAYYRIDTTNEWVYISGMRYTHDMYLKCTSDGKKS